MNQEWIIKNVLKHLDTVPDTPPDDRDYLPLEEAQRIVNETIDYLGANGDDIEYTYLNGHRKRLAHSLSMIPRASEKGQSCLDIGSYGYMLFWAKKHLGYDHVEGIEWHPGVDEPVIHRTLTLDDETIEVQSHNFDITLKQWPIDGTYDTVLFFEVLEHINHDPMGVMERIHERLKPDGTMVMSVPNAISYKALKEFLVGMPPWTYWFYEPDLSHEPRHCFEYTPIIFKTLIRATGLRENAFRTIYAYSESENEQETLEIARSFGLKDEALGETMIINATRISDSIGLRYPDVLYSPEGYYKNVYPQLHDRLGRAIEHFRNVNAPIEAEQSESDSIESQSLRDQLAELLATCDSQLREHENLQSRVDELETEKGHTIGELGQTRDWANDLQQQKNQIESRINELLFTCDAHLRRQEELQQQVETLESEKDQTLVELGQTRDWANDLQRQRSEHEAKINELLFTCDCYLRKEAEIELSIEAAQQASEAAKREAHDTRVWAENLSKENTDLRGQVNELLFACDCYLRQINDPRRCVQVIRERRFRNALRASKSVARKTPVLGTALRPVYRSTKKFIKRRM